MPRTLHDATSSACIFFDIPAFFVTIEQAHKSVAALLAAFRPLFKTKRKKEKKIIRDVELRDVSGSRPGY
jgi:hypothetical protein